MNWGYKILAVYIIFITGIVFLVVKASGENQDLVSKDYYDQELRYQERINETERANALSATVKFELQNETVAIRFPKEVKDQTIQATILLYCIADKSKDHRLSFTISDGTIICPLPAGNKGWHELQVSWAANGIAYYSQTKLLIQ